MLSFRKTAAGVAATAMLATPLAVVTASPASAADREFRCAGAEVDFSVDRDDGRYEVDVDLDDAKRGSKWRIKLRHNGKLFHKKVHRADSDGEIEIDKKRRNTAGKDRFKLRVKKIGGKGCTRVIKRR